MIWKCVINNYVPNYRHNFVRSHMDPWKRDVHKLDYRIKTWILYNYARHSWSVMRSQSTFWTKSALLPNCILVKKSFKLGNFLYKFQIRIYIDTLVRMDGTGNCRQEYGNFKQSTFINIPIPKGVPARHFRKTVFR